MCFMCVCQMLPSRLTPPPPRTLKTPVWTRPPISPSVRPQSLWVGQRGLLCHRVKTKVKHWDDLWTLSSLFSVTPPPAGALSHKGTLPASGPSAHRVPLAYTQTWTPRRCSSLLSLSPSLHPRWSRRCGTVNTSPPRTLSSPRLRGPSPRRP